MVYSQKPRCGGQKYTTVGTVVEKLQAFNAMYALNDNTNNLAACGLDDAEKAQWRKGVRDGVINCGGEPVEMDFFEKIFGGKQTPTDSTQITVKYNCKKDHNIFAEGAVTGSAPGQPVQFTVMRSQYAGNGAFSNVAVGGNIYIYEDKQWCVITAVDKTTPYAHLVTVVPESQYYTVNIRAKKKMMFNSTRIVDGYSSMLVASQWDTMGYFMKVDPFRIRRDWELPIDLVRPYQDILQFALMFDSNGNEVDTFELFETIRAREEFKFFKNLTFFMGQKRDNPLLLNGQNDQKYNGFDGYMPSLRYGGGFIYPYDPTFGFDMDSDLKTIILRQDALKKTKEFLLLGSLPFRMGLEARSQNMFKNNTGACTFQTFKRSGLKDADIVRMGIDSIKYMGYSMHLKTVSSLSDAAGIGNYTIPFTAMLLPGTGLKDSKGREVPAFEFFTPGGMPETGNYEEIFRDHRHLDTGAEKFSGTITETFQMVTHCPENHILIDPIYPCAS